MLENSGQVLVKCVLVTLVKTPRGVDLFDQTNPEGGC